MDKVKSIENNLSRPAGKIFWDEKLNKHVAVFQNCAPLYGSGLVFKEFDLDFPNYKEEEIARYNPKDIKCDLKKTLMESIHLICQRIIWLLMLYGVDSIYLKKTSRFLKKLERQGINNEDYCFLSTTIS